MNLLEELLASIRFAVTFTWIIQCIVAAFFASALGKEKGYSALKYFVGGLLFGFIALIATAGLPDRKKHDTSISVFTKQCPICKEMIHLEALKCKFCGNTFSEEDITNAINRLLYTSDEKNLKTIIDGLGERKVKEAIPALIDFLRRGGGEPFQPTQFNKRIFSSLNKINDSSCIPLLIDLLDEGSILLNKQIYDFIVNIGKGVLPLLEELKKELNASQHLNNKKKIDHINTLIAKIKNR